MRGSRPWWFRLGAWVIALVVALATVLLVVRSSSYAATSHTFTATPVPAPSGDPAGVVTEVTTYDEPVILSGGVALRLTERGATATALDGGGEVWSYERSDLPVCAHIVGTGRLLVFYANGSRCNEAISLDTATGQRQWQRTIEAGGANRIVAGDGAFFSIEPAKVIVYEQTQGYARFTLEPQREAGIPQATCEYLDAAGSTAIPILQRCQNRSELSWTYAILVNSASDGKPREDGRSYLLLPDPQLVGGMSNGTALVASGGSLYAVPVGLQEPIPYPGVTADGSSRAEVTVTGGALTSGGTGYVLGPVAGTVTWSGPVLSPVRMHRQDAIVLDADGLLRIDPRTGEQVRVPLNPPVTGPVDDVQLSGPYVAVTADGRTTLYR